MKASPPPPPPPPVADADADTLTAPPDEPPRKRKPWTKPTLSTIYGEVGTGSEGAVAENAKYRPS